MESDYISIVKDGSGVGKLSYYESKSSTVGTSQYLLPKKDFDIHFLYYALQTLKFEKYITGSSIPHIYFKDYSIEKLKVPEKEEQEKIGIFFKTIDKKIELLEEKHEKISYLKDFYYSKIFNINTLDELKIPYEKFVLEDVVSKLSTGLNPRKNFKLNSGGNNFYVTIKNFENGILYLDEKCDKIDNNALNLINKRSDLKKNDLIFASIGRVGEVYLIKEDPTNWNINESVFSLRANKNMLNPKFLYCLMKSNKIQHYFKTNITGSTFKSIKMKDLRKTPIILPFDIKKQEDLADFLLKFDKKENLIKKEIHEIIKFKKWLLQKMFI